MTELSLTPLTERFGVTVHDVDLHDVTATHLYPDIRAAFETHSALLFRGQDLDAEAHVALAGLFGPIEDRYADERREGERFTVPEVSNVRGENAVIAETDLHMLNLKSNMLWHADSTFMPVPALTNILAAKIVTTAGGATELASTRAAFADMTPARQDRLRRTRLRHNYAHSRARISPKLARLPMFNKWPDTVWPAVWRNPVTGAEAVYVASHAFAVEGMDETDGAAFIDRLTADCTAPDYVYAHRWQVGDVLLWDQRAVLHRGTPWPFDQPRRLTSICCSVTDADGLQAMRAAG
jgi:alpha-ketoglutarate-dependent 2,4-dichlorophenoxyacetate dioxygenase